MVLALRATRTNTRLQARRWLCSGSAGLSRAELTSNVVKPPPPEDTVSFMNLDCTDFKSMSRPDQIRHLEVEGYLVLPDILPPELCAQIKSEMQSAEFGHTDYSTAQQRALRQPQWHSRAVASLIGYSPMISLLRDLMGPEILFTRGFYQRSMPTCPGISMHCDGAPHGSDLFGYEGSFPKLLRVLYYLDDITEECAPFRLIARSHLSFHADANPYKRYKSHPEEVTITCRAGSAVLVPSLLFHGSHPNRSERSRELLQFGYRPAWAGPIQRITDDWDPELIEALPDVAKPFVKSLNTTGHVWKQPNKPEGMACEAPGINPSRWFPTCSR